MRAAVNGRRHWIAPLLAVVIAAGFAAPAGAVTAGAVPASATLVSQTEKARADVAAFRTEQKALLNTYVSTYGSRFTPTESAAIRQAQKDADRSLLTLQRATAKVDRLADAGASKARVHRAATEAQRAYLRAVTAAERTQTSLEPVLRNRLSLAEAFSAYRDYAGALGDFEDIGAQIDAIADRTTPRR